MKHLTDYEAGRIAWAVQDVALGAKIAADGEILKSAEKEFLALLRGCGARGVLVSLSENQDGRLTWRASRSAWALAALEWLERSGEEALGSVHLHWVQGLLYGYSPDAIEAYLVTLPILQVVEGRVYVF